MYVCADVRKINAKVASAVCKENALRMRMRIHTNAHL